MYDWRKMTTEERARALELRRARHLPWHSPPHLDLRGIRQYLVSSACYEHHHVIGKSPERITDCEESLLEICRNFCLAVYAWCLLPNHYHLLIRTDDIESCDANWGNSMDDHRTIGMARTMLAAERFGTTALSVR